MVNLVSSKSKAPGDVLTVPTSIRSKTIMEYENKTLSEPASHALSRGGKVIKPYTAWTIESKAKKTICQEHGLTGTDTARDICRAIQKTQRLALASHNDRKESSKNFPGICRGQSTGGDLDAIDGKDSIGVRVVLFKKMMSNFSMRLQNQVLRV